MPHQVPSALITSLQGVAGFYEAPFVAVHESGEQVTSIRFNPKKLNESIIDSHAFQPAANRHDNAELPSTTNEPISISLVPWCETGRYLSARPSFTLDPLFHAGGYYVQEASSMFLHHVVKTLYPAGRAPSRILDLCAAPGGKSTLLASAFPGSFMVSNEVIKNRVTILAENLSKWGSSNVAVTHNDPSAFAALPGYFNLVVVDAPCSGSGLFRKDPDAIEEWSEAAVLTCSLRQQRILNDVKDSIAHNGYLVYSTCSYSTAENEAICDWIVEQLELAPVDISVPEAWNITATSSPKSNAPGYRFYPNKVAGEGFFIACFQQQNSVEVTALKPARLPAPSKGEVALISSWCSDPVALTFFKQKETIIAFESRLADCFVTIQQKLHVRKSGVGVGVIKGKDFIPHHELALSHLLHANVPSIDLDKQEALRYLKRQDFAPDTNQKGWALATYKQLNLGWMKLLGNRVNNYYPTEWRILKP